MQTITDHPHTTATLYDGVAPTDENSAAAVNEAPAGEAKPEDPTPAKRTHAKATAKPKPVLLVEGGTTYLHAPIVDTSALDKARQFAREADEDLAEELAALVTGGVATRAARSKSLDEATKAYREELARQQAAELGSVARARAAAAAQRKLKKAEGEKEKKKEKKEKKQTETPAS